MSRRKGPPRYVPTLTEVVQPAPLPPPEPALIEAAATAAISAETQELMVRRVLQRTDLMIERRLHEAIGQLILEHTQAMMPRLREEIELVVRESVTQAFEQESSSFADSSGGLPVTRN